MPDSKTVKIAHHKKTLYREVPEIIVFIIPGKANAKITENGYKNPSSQHSHVSRVSYARARARARTLTRTFKYLLKNTH